MTIFNALLFGIVAMFILANLSLLVAAVVWAMGGFTRLTKSQRPILAQRPIMAQQPIPAQRPIMTQAASYRAKVH